MWDKLNSANVKLRGEEERLILSLHLCPMVTHKGRHLGVVRQLQALPVVGNETQPETALVNISITIRDHGTLPRRNITLFGRWLKCQLLK